ncbi:MAG: outer membrane lipoprotein-sorting protein [Nibricoccus sp.]
MATLAAFAQEKIYRPPANNYLQFGKPDQAEGRRILEDFRQTGLPSDMYWEVALQVMPRRGEGKMVPARLWIGRNEKGPIWRVELWPNDAAQKVRLLVQNGPQSALWRWQAGQIGKSAEPLGIHGLFEPLAATDLTAFDLQMSFLFWNDFVFEGLARVRGRPAHVFLLYPPAEVTAQRPQLCGVRVYLDTQFKALVQAEQIGDKDALLKSITILDLKKVDDQWIPKSVDVRNDETRNKTRLVIARAALNLDLLPVLFAPESLSETIQPPAPERLRLVTQ